MSVLWEKLAGDTDRFAFKVAFHGDPDRGVGATAEESFSWGAFQVWVQGQNLCAHMEQNEVVESAHWYLISLLEWLAGNWDALLHEERLPVRNEGSHSWESLYQTRFAPMLLDDSEAERWDAEWHTWWSRHNLQACRDGGLFPDLFLRRWWDKVEISWGDARIPGATKGLRFTAPAGVAVFEPLEVARALFDVLRDASAFLMYCMPGSERIARLWDAVEGIRTPREEIRLAWLAGLDRSADMAVERWRHISKVLRDRSAEAALAVLDAPIDPLVINGSCHAALMFGSVSPTVSEADALTLASELSALFEREPEKVPLADLTKEVPACARTRKPHEEGYELAEEVLQKLRLPNAGQTSIDIEGVCVKLGARIGEIRLQDSSIRAVAVAGEHHWPAVLLNPANAHNQGEAGRRFTLAHELCHLLFDRSRGRKLALASGPWAPQAVEQRAGAFAAMFLMPPALVRRATDELGEPIESLDQLSLVSKQLGTGYLSALDHLYNLHIIDDAVRERVRAEIDRRAAG